MKNPEGVVRRRAADVKPGDVFGRLTTIEKVKDLRNGTYWRCVCTCGSESVARQDSLKTGNTKSCGCWRRDSMAELFTKHGKTNTTECVIWQNMIYRCHVPSSPAFILYGGRGITVCDRWRHSFENFLADMGKRPVGKTLDRRDNNSGYRKENCRWATGKEQSRNCRSNRFLTVGGQTKLLVEWSESTGTPLKIIHTRLRRGWSEESAVMTPWSPLTGARFADGAQTTAS
jgi:hypothetical protein